MLSGSNLAPLDPDIVEMERRWRESGVPGIYAGRNGPVSRERARNVGLCSTQNRCCRPGGSRDSRSRVQTSAMPVESSATSSPPALSLQLPRFGRLA